MNTPTQFLSNHLHNEEIEFLYIDWYVKMN